LKINLCQLPKKDGITHTATEETVEEREEGRRRRALWLVALDGKLVYKTNYMENVLIFINPRRSKQTTTASVDTRTQKFSGLFLKLTV